MTKIAEFKMIGAKDYGFRSVWHFSRTHDGQMSGFVRTSDWIDVEFPPRPDDAQLPDEIAQLDAKLAEVKEDFARKVGAIEEAKANLLAITDQRESA